MVEELDARRTNLRGPVGTRSLLPERPRAFSQA
jgi:hypothetical protein